MPEIGEPTTTQRNSFSKIGMRRDENTADRLNQLAGNEKFKMVSSMLIRKNITKWVRMSF